MTSGSLYSGVLVVDKPRHRMNTMPEWFTAEPEENYIVEDLNTGAFQTSTGTQLHDGLPVMLEAGVETLRLIRPE